MIKLLLKWLRKISFYPCQGYWTESNSDHPSEFDCNAENAGEVTCENCLCNFGIYNPDTGKKDYIRYFFIRFDRWRRNLFRKCSNCEHSYCVLDVIPDWRCKESGKDIMIEANGYCKKWSADWRT